ncbi:hypothetical protein SAMN06295905_0641 [Devosia lucknowensis]|uniref:Uncharacterized protein n=1 Tax=Devosia lucknowensis TaxID=1096929 RepID=A0A1Y6EM31_9HYPH|nr:hypothetical protein [Devosia lucknowensis]SMQ62261.1 hypothetical protein SAMN06295905_0641 [Devosia lucknowensis]
MTIKTLFYPLALLPVFVLAACGDAPDDAVTVENNPDGSSTLQIQVPESMSGAADAIANPDAAIENLRQQAGQMSEDAKVQAVASARTVAEEAARVLGRTDAEVRQAGDDAERRAREALGLQ